MTTVNNAEPEFVPRGMSLQWALEPEQLCLDLRPQTDLPPKKTRRTEPALPARATGQPKLRLILGGKGA